MSELPENWATAKLGALGVWSGGGTPSKRNPRFWEGGTIPWVSPKDMKFVSIDDSQDHITESAVKGSATKILPKGSLLVVTRSGILQHSLPVATNSRDVTLNQDLKALTPKAGFDVKYLYFALRRFERDILHECCKAGTTVQSIEFPRLKDFEIPIAPLPEQRRIVARIEELFSRLDAGVAALRHAKAQLQRYRQSVLAAAVTGKLTQAWREQHPETEPAERLLERIHKQRREQWRGRRKYTEPPAPVTDELPDLPTSWTWATVAQQADPDERSITDGPFGSKLKSSHYTESGPRVLRLQNIGDGVFKDEYAHISEEHFETLTSHQIFVGDLLIRALGIPPHQTCRIPEGVGPAIVKADCIRFKVFETHIDPKFTLLALNSHPVRIRTEKHIHGVGRPRLNGAEIKSIALPLPPLAEQHQIVAEVEARTTAIDHLEAELDRQITRSNHLRQSTLASAFRGDF